MGIRRSWQVAVLAATAVTMLVLASGGAARSATTYTVGTSAQLNTALAAAGPGDTILIKPATYFTADATVPMDGFSNANGGVMITGKTDLNGKCTKTSTTILDGDYKPTVGPGHTGVVFTVGGDNTKFQCFTMRFGTAGISSDGYSGLNVKSMVFTGNGRDLNAGAPVGDGIWVQDGDNVIIKKSTFSGMGFDGIQSTINLSLSNDGWVVQQNVLKNIHSSCIDAGNNTTTQVGAIVSGVPVNGNTCFVAGTNASDDAIIVKDGGVGGTPNIIAANTVTNSWFRCFRIESDNAKFMTNTCTASHDNDGVSLSGDGIVSDKFTTGQTYNDCINSNGDNQTITNTKCGPTRDYGVQIFGDGTTVTNLKVTQSNNACLDSEGDNQVWMTASCGHVTGTDSDDYGLDAEGTGSSFTGIAIGDTYSDCFRANNSFQTFTTISCHGSGNDYGIYVNDNDVTVNGFDMGSTYNGCAFSNDVNTTFKNGHCARVLQNEAVFGSSDGLTIDTVVVDAAYGDCFAMYGGSGGKLLNSTGTQCGTGELTDGGIDWEATGTNTISNNKIKQSSDNSLLVDAAGGTYTIMNNTFRNAQNDDCVNVSTPDALTMTGNKAQGCYDSAFDVAADVNPKVNSNTGLDASGIAGNATMHVRCDTTCNGAQVNSNTLDGGSNETQGLLVTSNGTNGLTISGNLISNMTGTGLEVDGSATTTLTNNTVLNSSDTDDLFGIFLNSDGNTLTGSTVSGGYDNGIEVAGDNNIVNNNVNVTLNGEDGIHIAGTADATSLTGNTATNNAGEGLEDDGTNTTWTNNTSSGNRQDCAGTDATFTDGGGNVCADGTFFTDPGSILAPDRHHKKK
jgi:hypothetical protein